MWMERRCFDCSSHVPGAWAFAHTYRPCGVSVPIAEGFAMAQSHHDSAWLSRQASPVLVLGYPRSKRLNFSLVCSGRRHVCG